MPSYKEARLTLAALTWIGCITCIRCGQFEHFQDTDEFTLNSRGVLRNIVELSEDNGIKRLLCKDNVILVAMTNLSYADSWSEGDIVVGGAEWGCVMTDREEGRDNHLEWGFHRIIDSLQVKANKRVDIYTRPAGLFDLFLEANIFYHHHTKDPIVMPEQHHGRRSRRSIVPWKATSEDIPIEYDVTVKEAFPSAGKVVYDEGSINTTLSFYEIRMMLDQVDFHKQFEQILPINYNEEGDNSRGYFGFRNGKFVYNSSYFEEDDVESSSTDKQTDTETGESWEILCEDCFMYYLPEVIFELEIDQIVGVKRYALQLNGPFETNINLKGSASGEMSILVDEIFHRAPEHLWISIPLVEEIEMYLTPKFNVTMDAHLDMKVTGAGEFKLGYDHVGNLTIVREWTQDGHIQEYQFEPEGSTREHSREVDVAGELFYNVSMMTSVIDLKADIFWKLPKNIFGFYLTSPMQIRVEPNVLSRSVLDADQVACVEAEANVISAIYLEDIIYDTELLGQKYNFLILPDKDNNTFYMMEPEPVVQDRDICKVRCYGPDVTDKTLAEANTTTAIIRGDSNFDSLSQLLGDLILFAPEGSGLDWCGKEGRACLECTTDIVGKDVDERCSTRLLSRSMALHLDQLAHWVVEHWKKEKLNLYVVEAWNEPNSQYPDGKYGDESLYYEGRAVKVSLSQDPTIKSPKGSPAETFLPKLSQLAVCAGFPYVELHDEYVELGVDPDTVFTSEDQQHFMDFFQNAPPQNLDFCNAYSEYFPELSPGESMPNDTTAEEALGGIDSRILRHNEGDFLQRLFYYPYDNVDFLCEELTDDWCGSPTRDCLECDTGMISDYGWSRCADRVMTPRLAAKLYHLADMMSGHPALSGDRLVVLEAWDEATSTYPEGMHPEGSLHYEGRSVQLSLTSVTPAKLASLSSVALCAGFDAVYYASETYIEASVKNQEGYFTVHVQFLEGQVLQVMQPPFYELEYGYPEEFTSETRLTDLFDGEGEHGEVYLSSNFQVKEFMCPLRRYVRINKKLVECLQWTREFIQEPIEILAAYKSRSYNLENFEQRHPKETYRFQSGHAAEIRITGYKDPNVLTQLATAVLKSCSAGFRLEQHTLGVGLHDDRVYVHVKIASVEELDNWLEVWNVNGNEEGFQVVEAMRTSLMNDGPPIVPQSWDTACDIPDLGYDKYYFQVQIRPSCRDKSLEFCQHSLQAREYLVTNLTEQMHPILGFSDGPLFAQNPDVDDCFANLCGSCNGAGSIWQKKLVACSKMLWSIKHLLYRELKPDQTAFFNTDNTESTVHGIACRSGKVCLENTQVYSVFAPLIMSTYRPDSERAMEVRLYEGTNNPSPIIDLVEQEMAFRAKGRVHVYLEYERDLSALKKVIKILMAYNKDVTEIQFHVNTTIFHDHVYERIQDWIDIWRYDVCPLWSRSTLAPFSLDEIPEEQVAFGMKDSQIRNALQREVRNRDLAWIMKM